MALSKPAAASLALWLSLEQPAVFDRFVASLPGARAVGLGALGDDGDDDIDYDIADDTSDDSFTDSDGSLLPVDVTASYSGTDDDNLSENLRELGVDTDDATYSTPVPGSAADTGIVGPVEGSLADTVTGPDAPTGVVDLSGAEQQADTDLQDTSDIATITPVVQGISGSAAVKSIGAPAVSAATSALTSPSGLSALANAATSFFNEQAAAGAEQTELQAQAQDLQAQTQLAALGHSATGVVSVTNPQTGQTEEVLANTSTGQPIVGANGAYIPAATGEGILSTLVGSSDLVPVLLIGGAGLLLLLLLSGGHHPLRGGAYSGAPRAPRQPRFIEVE